MKNKLTKITKEDYFKSEGLSNSFLKEFNKSPCHAFIKKESTKSQESGTMFHDYILENETFHDKYIVSEYTDKRTKEYKSFEILHPGKNIISTEIEFNLQNAKRNVDRIIFDYQELGNILNESQKEIACYSEMFGFQCKGLFDALYEKDNNYIIFDLKKCQDALEFHRAIVNYQYYRQTAWYISLLDSFINIFRDQKKEIKNNIRFIFIAIEENYPNGCILYELDDEYINYGDLLNMNAVKLYSDWKDRGEDITEMYQKTYKVIEKPSWLN